MKIYAPFAGVVRFSVADGDVVEAGAQLAVVEAIKLESPVLAPTSGTVVRANPGDFVDVQGGDQLMEIA